MMCRAILMISIFFLSCSKDQECIFIRDKGEESGSYYFYFNANYYSNSQTNNLGGVIDSQFASGKVSKQVYDSHNIGDEYCY